MSVFLKIPGIQGAVTDPDYRGWVPAEMVRLEPTRPRAPTNSGVGTARPSPSGEEVVVLRIYDASSSLLQAAVARNTVFDRVEAHYCSIVNGRARPFATLSMRDVIITNYDFNGYAGVQGDPTEALVLNSTKMEFRTLQPVSGGATDPSTAAKAASRVNRPRPTLAR